MLHMATAFPKVSKCGENVNVLKEDWICFYVFTFVDRKVCVVMADVGYHN